ncbi:hypothetical protein LMG23992_01131 [Cupriavidus laharis]|uniref:TRASH domain-containing protein n=1 Tax=Cupriavidus laharis TaxID=151654 RepID=A0ABM8WM04_9BURK|nr:XdhC family protein [Cupriavidus laharis]CAG9168439.1 hypothetical protein LMG23992_01131 [Cupriavidus laharis]
MNTDTDFLLQREQWLIHGAHPFAVATVIRAQPPTSAWVGAQALIEADGTLHGWIGGGCSREIVIQAALESIRSGSPRLVRISNAPTPQPPDVEDHAMPCASNGALELFVQPTLPAPLVLVMGATPTALEACVLAQRVGLRVAAAAPASVPLQPLGLTRVITGYDKAAIAELAPRLVLVATQGEGDETALEAALASPATAVLLVASARKAEKLREAMLACGVPPARLEALHAPAGPAIHARTPEEIALGAVAGLVALRRSMEASAGGAQADTVPPVPPCEALGAPHKDADSTDGAGGTYLNPVCGMAIARAGTRHVIEYGGERHYFCCDCCKAEFERDPAKYMALLHARGEKALT